MRAGEPRARKPASASSAAPEGPAGHAVDGLVGTHWNSTGPPGGWIEIDLGAQYDISLLRLVVAQTPPGRAAQGLQACDRRRGARHGLYELDASTADGQNVEIAPASPWTGRALPPDPPVWGPSWPAWREIQVFKAL